MGLTVPAIAPDSVVSKAEAAELLGCSVRSVERKRSEFDIASTRPARNGREEPLIAVPSLPLEAQEKWVEKARQLTPAPGQLALGITRPIGPNLSTGDQARAEARFCAIEPLVRPDKFQPLWLQYGNRKCDVVRHLAEQNRTAIRTIYNWLEGWNSAGIAGLAPRDRADKGQPRSFTNADLDFLLAAALPQRGSRGELSVRDIFRAHEEERQWRAANAGKRLAPADAAKYGRYLDSNGCLLGFAQLAEASYQTFLRWYTRIPEVVRVMGRSGEEAFHNTQEILSFRAISEIRPLDYVVMDHRVLDIFCLAPQRGGGWKLIRPWLTAAIDMRTRKWLAWVIVETPSSDSIAAVLKRVFIDHGLPVAVYWDNGKDFKCEWLEGRQSRSNAAEAVRELPDAWRGVLDTLGIRVHHAIVKRARSKIIEPNFTRIAYFDRTLPEWCGHKPTARPERFDALMKQHEAWERKEQATTPFRTIGQVAALYNDAINDLNERELQGEGMQKITPSGRGWMVPNEAWEILIRGVERRTIPSEVLGFCFAKRDKVTVKHGEVRKTFGGKPFHYRIIGNPVKLMALNGVEVEIAYDPLDLSEAAIYHENRFAGLARCADLRRMGEDAFVQDEKDRRASRREVRKFIEAVHQAVPVADPETRLARRKAVLPARESVARVEVPVALPAAMEEAESALRAEREFRFENAPADVARATQPTEADEDSAFHFFSDQGD